MKSKIKIEHFQVDKSRKEMREEITKELIQNKHFSRHEATI